MTGAEKRFFGQPGSCADCLRFIEHEMASFERAVATTKEMIKLSPEEGLIGQLRYYKDCVACCKKMLHDATLIYRREHVVSNGNANQPG